MCGLTGPKRRREVHLYWLSVWSRRTERGELNVFGYDPALEPRRIKERLGVVPQENALDEELTVS